MKRPKRKNKNLIYIRNAIWLGALVSLVLLGILISSGYTKRADNGLPTASSAGMGSQPASDSSRAQQMMDLSLRQTRHFLGSPDAPVTILEFSDFQ